MDKKQDGGQKESDQKFIILLKKRLCFYYKMGGKGGVRLYEKYICMEGMPQASRDHIRRIGTSHGYC